MSGSVALIVMKAAVSEASRASMIMASGSTIPCCSTKIGINLRYDIGATSSLPVRETSGDRNLRPDVVRRLSPPTSGSSLCVGSVDTAEVPPCY